MNTNRILLLPVVLLLFSCSGNKKHEVVKTDVTASDTIAQIDSFPVSQVVPAVQCRKNPDLSFALFLPHQFNDHVHLPVLIFADPHGSGSFPLEKYQGLAEAFGVILIGSNDSKNGVTFDVTTPVFQSLEDEAVQRFHCADKQISLAGFSGGAKAVLVAAAQSSSVMSVLYCGAALPQLPSTLPPALAIAGTKDMNYSDVLQADGELESGKAEHALIEWNGKHEWSDTGVFQSAFYWIKFRAIEKKFAPADDAAVHFFLRENSKTFSDPIREELRLHNLFSFLKGVSDVSSYSTALVALRNKKNYQQAVQKQQDDLALESRMKQNYLACIDAKDLYWWVDESKHLKTAKKDPMNERILGYISLACYSYSNKALAENNLQKAEKYLGVYSFVDTENPDRAYMQAILYARMNNTAGTIQSLREAVSYGFTDKPKLLAEPSFEKLKDNNDFNEILSQLN